MSVIVFTLCILAGSMLAGIVGALTGLGGGVILVPMLVLLFKVNVHYAVGASLMSVIATSSGATVAYLREGYTNLRVGMFLQVASVRVRVAKRPPLAVAVDRFSVTVERRRP